MSSINLNRYMVFCLIVSLVMTVVVGERMLDSVTRRHAAEGKLAAILESSNRAAMFVTVEVDSGVAVVSASTRGAEYMFGYDVDELIGQPIDILMSPEDRMKHRVGFARWLESTRVEALNERRETWALQVIGCTGFTKSGKRFPIVVTTTRVASSDKTTIEIFSAIYDARNAKVLLQNTPAQKEPT